MKPHFNHIKWATLQFFIPRAVLLLKRRHEPLQYRQSSLFWILLFRWCNEQCWVLGLVRTEPVSFTSVCVQAIGKRTQ